MLCFRAPEPQSVQSDSCLSISTGGVLLAADPCWSGMWFTQEGEAGCRFTLLKITLELKELGDAKFREAKRVASTL